MKRVLLLLFAASIASAQAPPGDPTWWSEGNPPVKVPGAAVNNKGPANIGQAKYMAKNALDAIEALVPSVAAAIRVDLVGPGKAIATFDPPQNPDQAWLAEQKAPLLVGQLKAIAAPFYNKLNNSAPAWLLSQRNLNGINVDNTHLPWSQDSHPNNKSMATIGQLKALFALRFEADLDIDGMSDFWEQSYNVSDPILDADNDGLTNHHEFSYRTSPVNPDTESDGMPDGWEVIYNFDPRAIWDALTDFDKDGLTNLEEFLKGTNPLIPDSDGDGITDGGESDQSTNPNDPFDKPDAEWFILTGDKDQGVKKTRKRTIKIPAGDSRVITVVLASEEYPYWTYLSSDFNDVVEWKIQTNLGDLLEGSVDVNDRHEEWDIAANDARECKGFNPAHVENGMTLTAPDYADLIVDIELSATNISDGALPSTILVGILPLIPLEFYPQLLDDYGNPISGSQNPRNDLGETNGMKEEAPTVNRIAHREIKMRIVDGDVLEGKQLTWSMAPLFIPHYSQNGPNLPPVFRGDWAKSTTHPNRYETAVHFGANGFEPINQATAHTDIDENGESAIRANLAPIGFNKGRLLIKVEDFQGSPARVADMEVPAVVVIDPGHGGQDSGAVGRTDTSILEKDLALEYSLSLRQEVIAKFAAERRGLTMVMTRETTGEYMENSARAILAGDKGADVFISVHFNDGAISARGTETLVRGNSNVNELEDTTLANLFLASTLAAVQSQDAAAINRGVKNYAWSKSQQKNVPSQWAVLSDSSYGNTNDYHPIRGSIVEVEFLSHVTALESVKLSNTKGKAIKTKFATDISTDIYNNILNQP